MGANNEEEIFYSDDDLSDSELYQGSNLGSRYFPGKTDSIFSSKLWPNSDGLSISPDTDVSNTIYNTIDSPINQISFGISNLLSNNTPLYNKSAPAKQMSWSSVAKKEPLQPVKPLHNLPRQPAPAPARTSLNNKTDSKTKPGHVSSKVTETAISAGYRFKARNPEPDPRYPSDQQLMVGPIPGHLEHDVIYNGLRGIFQSKGPVCFMFVHKSAVKDNDSGKLVKFGYVVFAEKGVAQKVMKEGYTIFQGHKIAVKDMLNRN